MSTKTLSSHLLSFFVILLLGSPASAGKKNNSPCDKPPEIVLQPKLANEQQRKAREIRAQGTVNISISEYGEVIDARVVRASSTDAVDLLLGEARSMKFKPRSGCGATHIVVNFTHAGS
jgi:hypothetical protein